MFSAEGYVQIVGLLSNPTPPKARAGSAPQFGKRVGPDGRHAGQASVNFGPLYLVLVNE